MSRVSTASSNQHNNTSYKPQYQLSALAGLACSLDSRQYSRSDRTRRASVCILLRVHSNNTNNVRHNSTAQQQSNNVQSNNTSSSTTQQQSNIQQRKYSTTEQFNSSEPIDQPNRSSRRLVNILTSINRLGIHSGFHESNTELQIMYMLRQHNPRDRWSGQIAFPGGRQQNNETDEQTCIREVYEEVGLDLNDGNDFICLGRLDDYHIDPLAPKLKSMSVSVFVYLQLNNNVQVKLDTNEVRAVIWCNIAYFMQDKLPWSSLKFPVARVTESDKQRAKTPHQTHMQINQKNNNNNNNTQASSKQQQSTIQQHNTSSSISATAAEHPVKSGSSGLSSFVDSSSQTFSALLPISFFPFSIHFPALTLQGQYITANGHTGYTQGSKNTGVVAKQDNDYAHIISTNNDNNNDSIYNIDIDTHIQREFILWGFTLRVTSHLISIMGNNNMIKYLDMSDRSSRILQWIVNTNNTLSSVYNLSAFNNLGNRKHRHKNNNNSDKSKISSKL